MQQILDLSQQISSGQARTLYQVPEIKSYTTDELFEIIGPAQAVCPSLGCDPDPDDPPFP
jgi:hypothetical protein